MTKMNQKERELFYDIIEADLNAIRMRVVNQIESLWEISRNEIIQERGLDKIREAKDNIKAQIDDLREQLKKMEEQLQETLNVGKWIKVSL